ncbi:hypothetical protein BY458DRAFT_516707 [Sporodiniella umbellata]|nr:hypothetical protein BY458DRAFT_516707 [Sporodiniella umbellata]
MGSKPSKILRSNVTKKKRNTVKNTPKKKQETAKPTEQPKQIHSNDIPTINNDEIAVRPNHDRSFNSSYPSRASRSRRRSRLPSSSSAANSYLFMASNEDMVIQPKSNMSSGWTALSNEPFSQFDVNTSTFTMVTEHSTISRKSIYQHETPYTASSTSSSNSSTSIPIISLKNLHSQLKNHPSQTYHIIKQSFQKAQLQNDPEDWSHFYKAMEYYTKESQDVVGLVHLAMCLISGLGCAKDEQRGLELLKSRPTCETNYVLGHCYLDGLPVKPPHSIQAVDHVAAFEYFKSAAHDYEPTNESIADTVAEAQCRLARMLFQGQGVQQNSEEGMDYLTQSAENKNRYAQFLMGVHNECGLEIPQDLKKAKEYYQKSAQQGFADAQAALGNQYVMSDDYEQGLQWLDKAAKQGNSRAHVQLAMMYDKGVGVDQNNETALLYYKTAAEKNNRAGQYLLGLVYYFGRLGKEQNIGKATKLIRLSASAGYPFAQRVLGQFYQQPLLSSGIQKNEREAVRWYKRAAINKDMIALDLLGRCHQHGIGVEVDLEKALAYYTKAAERHDSSHVFYAKMDQALLLQHMGRHASAFKVHSEILENADPVRDKEPMELAKLSLGRYHLRSDIQGIPHHPSLSFKLWTELVETTQHPDAFYWLGSCYDEGIPGVCEIDRVKAFLLFTTAAELGDSDSMFTVAGMMSNYLIPNKGPVDAFPWYQKAALKGHPRAMYALGLCYHKGIGVDQPQIETALDWLERASKQGVTEAMSHMAKIYLQLRTLHPEGQYSVKAVQWLKRAADREDVYAQRELGKMYMSGEGLAANHTVAFQLLQKATLKNDAEAMAFLGHCYRKGNGVEKNLEKASEYYLKSALLGYAFAYSAAAELYYEVGDFERAYKYYLLASKVPGIFQSKTGMTARLMVARLVIGYIPAANQKALRNLENTIQSDYTTAVSLEEAFETLLKLAVEDQFILAFEPLGYCYMNGLGIESNRMQALIWLQKAADGSKNGAACFHLYEIYSNRVPVDVLLALQYLRQSADLGYTEAQYRMGMIHLRGDFGHLQDDRAATEWFKLSASQLHAPSIWTLSQMAGLIGQEDLKWQYQKSAASLGHVASMRELGQHYLTQHAAPFVNILVQQETLDQALHYLHMAANADDIESLILLGKTYNSCTKSRFKFSTLQNHLPTPDDSQCEEEVISQWQAEEEEKLLAIPFFEKASALGSLDATVYAAEAWHEQKQYAAALEHFQKAASQGHALARFFCARYSLEGYGGVPKDQEKGFKELLFCANELQCIHAYNMLGQCYENGVGVTKNNGIAYEWYSRAAEATRDPESYYRIAKMYSQKRVSLPANSIHKDMEALKMYQLATKAHGPSCYELGMYFLHGISDPESAHQLLAPNLPLSIEYFRAASDSGIKEAMVELGMLLLTAVDFDEQEEGLRRLKSAAELGSCEAQFQLGLLYHHGKNAEEDEEQTLVPQDLQTAYDLFNRASVSRHASATYYLALYHHHGILEAPNLGFALDRYHYAISLFNQVCDEQWQAEYNLASLQQPDAPSYTLFQNAYLHAPQDKKHIPQMMIARYHLHGWGDVPVQPQEAAASLIHFAHQKHEAVYLDVAQCYEEGLGVQQDLAEAFYWYGEAISRDSDEVDPEEEAIALFKLSEFYRHGRVVNTNLEKAHRLCILAAKKGSREAHEVLKRC